MTLTEKGYRDGAPLPAGVEDRVHVAVCFDCEHALVEHQDNWHHPSDQHAEINRKYPDILRCGDGAEKHFNVVTGRERYEDLPKCKQKNLKGRCPGFAPRTKTKPRYRDEFREFMGDDAVEGTPKRLWWRFWRGFR